MAWVHCGEFWETFYVVNRVFEDFSLFFEIAKHCFSILVKIKSFFYNFQCLRYVPLKCPLYTSLLISFLKALTKLVGTVPKINENVTTLSAIK